MSVVVSNDGDEQTGTQAETGLIRFVAHMIKCYIHSQIMVAAIERKISLKKKKLSSPSLPQLQEKAEQQKKCLKISCNGS